MKVAAANAIASLAREFVPDEVATAMVVKDLIMEKTILYHLLLTQGY